MENVISLSQFVEDFGDGLLEAVARQNPPVYDGAPDPFRELVMDTLVRKPFDAQRDAVQAVIKLLHDAGEPAAIINAEMGTGKTMMAISTAAVMHAEGARRFLVISPPHLVYKWRREIRETIDGARVWVLNGPDTLRKLIAMRGMIGSPSSDEPEFFVLGRVRMRMGFHWRPVVATRRRHIRQFTEEGNERSRSFIKTVEVAACPDCGQELVDGEGNPVSPAAFPDDVRRRCPEGGGALWTLVRPGKPKRRRDLVGLGLLEITTSGAKSADRL